MAIAGLAAFVAAVALQHVLEPQLEPTRHQISEYSNAGAGALMVAGFIAWATSLLASAAVVWRAPSGSLAPAGRVVIAGLLAVGGVGILLTAVFATQTSAGVLPPGRSLTITGRIHDLASGVASLALLGAVATSIVWVRMPPWLPRLAAALLAVSLPAAAVLLAVGDPLDGVRQRVLVGAACIWQGALVAAVGRRTGHDPRASAS